MAAIVYWSLTISYMAVIFFLSSITFPEASYLPEGSDKVIHAGLYFILAVLSYLSFMKSSFRWSFPMAFLFSAFYGITDEFHQAFVPGRDAAVGDAVADAVGAFSGSFLAHLINIRK